MCACIYTYMQKRDMRPKAQSSLYIHCGHSLKSCVPGPGVQRALSQMEKASPPAEITPERGYAQGRCGLIRPSVCSLEIIPLL